MTCGEVGVGCGQPVERGGWWAVAGLLRAPFAWGGSIGEEVPDRAVGRDEWGSWRANPARASLIVAWGGSIGEEVPVIPLGWQRRRRRLRWGVARRGYVGRGVCVRRRASPPSGTRSPRSPTSGRRC